MMFTDEDSHVLLHGPTRPAVEILADAGYQVWARRPVGTW